MLGTPREVITPFQRLMQSSAIVSIYEGLWRRIGYYLASSRSFSREVRTVLGQQRGKSASPMLDLACGTGVFTRPLARQIPGPVVGFDLSLPMLRHARRLIDRDGLKNVFLVRGTVFHLPFVAESFPYLNCCGALHLFDKPDDALKEILRVLRSDGHMCIQTTIRPERSVGVAYVLEHFIRFGFFDETELRRKLQDRDFNILTSERHRISYTLLAQKKATASQ